ncbi:ABC transporter permease subunit [Dactylosporangium sp. NPDC000244]|uniref:ABC transporter permease n=1 Tax=Dactylosporangium sp. NPDC000244 TaxID=3154365 RepID=UPI00332B2434
MKTVDILKRILLALGLPAVLLAVWWSASAGSVSFFWPPLSTIVQAFPETWFAKDPIMHDVLPSLTRLVLGYLIALVAGVGLGTAIGSSPTLRALSEPTLEFFRALPPPVLIPVIALFAGFTGWTPKLVTIALGCVWPILLNTVEGVRSVDEVLRDTARSYHLGRLATTRSCRPVRPDPRCGSAPPTPSSQTVRCSVPSRVAACTCTTVAWACLAALASASDTR